MDTDLIIGVFCKDLVKQRNYGDQHPGARVYVSLRLCFSENWINVGTLASVHLPLPQPNNSQLIMLAYERGRCAVV